MSKYFYKKADKSKRPVMDVRPQNVTITGPHGLYNENLTAEELMLLRTLIWDSKNTGLRGRDFIDFLHSWMFTNEKIPTVYPDIQEHLDEGVNYEDRLAQLI